MYEFNITADQNKRLVEGKGAFILTTLSTKINIDEIIELRFCTGRNKVEKSHAKVIAKSSRGLSIVRILS